jgi:hypothetical protein
MTGCTDQTFAEHGQEITLASNLLDDRLKIPCLFSYVRGLVPEHLARMPISLIPDTFEPIGDPVDVRLDQTNHNLLGGRTSNHLGPLSTRDEC